MRVLDEFELSRLVFSSKATNANIVQKWIFDEVLPYLRPLINNLPETTNIVETKSTISGNTLASLHFVQKELEIKSDIGVTAMTIHMRSDGYVNATQIAKAAGKKVNHWGVLDSTQELIEQLSTEAGIPASGLITIIKGGNNKTAQGSWIHPKLAIHFAMWCSPSFALQVSNWILELGLTGRVELGKEKSSAELVKLQKQLFVITTEKQKLLVDKEQSDNQVVSLQNKLKISFIEREQQQVNTLIQQCDALNLNQFTTLVNYLLLLPAGDKHRFEFKYGQSQDFNKRLKDHRNTYGDVHLIAIVKSSNGLIFERKFTEYLANKGLLTGRVIDSIIHREIFTINKQTPLSEVLAMFNNISHDQYSPSESDIMIQTMHNENALLITEKANFLKEIEMLKKKILMYESPEKSDTDINILTNKMQQQQSSEDYKTTLLANYQASIDKICAIQTHSLEQFMQRESELNNRILTLETEKHHLHTELVALLSKYDLSMLQSKQQSDVLLAEILKLKASAISTDDRPLITSEDLINALPEEKKDDTSATSEFKIAPTHSGTFVSVDKTRKITYLNSDLDENGVERSKECKACKKVLLFSLFIKIRDSNNESKRANICKVCKHNSELNNKTINASAALEHKQLCHDCAIEKPIACFQGDRRVCIDCTNRQRRESQNKIKKYILEHPNEIRNCKICKKDLKLSEFKGNVFTTCHSCNLAKRKTNYAIKKLKEKSNVVVDSAPDDNKSASS